MLSKPRRSSLRRLRIINTICTCVGCMVKGLITEGWGLEGRAGDWKEGLGTGRKGWGLEGRAGDWKEGLGTGRVG